MFFFSEWFFSGGDGFVLFCRSYRVAVKVIAIFVLVGFRGYFKVFRIWVEKRFGGTGRM